MSQKSKTMLSVLCFLLLFLALGLISYFFFLPYYIERKILPDLGHQRSVSLSGKVYNLGLSSADFGKIILGNSQNPAVSIGLIHADYSLPNLLASHKVNSVTINGLSLQLKFADGKFMLPGVDLEKYGASKAESQNLPQSDSIKLPVMLDSLEVTNGMLSLKYDDKHLLVPFTLSIQTEKQAVKEKSSTFRIILHLLFQGEDISVDGFVDLSDNNGSFSLETKAIDLNRILEMAGISHEMITLGAGSIAAKTEIRLAPFQLLKFQIAGDLDPIQVNQIPVRFASHENNQDPQEPSFSLDLNNENEKWLMQARTLISEPFGASLNLQSSLAMTGDMLHSTGSFILTQYGKSVPDHQVKSFSVISNIPEIEGDFDLDINRNGTWQASVASSAVKASKKEILTIGYSSIDLKTSKPSFTLTGNGNTQQDELGLGLSLHSTGLQLQYNNTAIKTPQLNLKASYRLDKGQTLKSGVAKFDLSLNNTELQQNGLSGSGDVSLQGRVEIPGKVESIYQASGSITVDKGEIYEAKNKLKMRGIKGKIPWHWPTAAQNSSGQIKIADIHFDDYDLGNFRANLRLRGMTYYLDGSYTSSLLPGIIADITGQAEMAPSGIQGEFAGHIEPTPVESLELGKFHPNLHKSFFSGRIGLESTLHFNSEGIKGNLQARVQQGKFEMPEKKYLIENIDLSLLLPVLPDLRSAPAQKILFAKAALGDIVFEDGKIIWQLESPESLLVEESEFHWAGGRVFTSAVRLAPDMKILTVPIFCDRLKLADLLEQFGVSNATGEGTVSGRIPVTIGKKSMKFEDGFLYSSPGHGGSIKVAAFDTLGAGIPKNTPQFAQIDFAAEALKNFSYNWVKLLFNTEGEDLVMQMQMDGKPLQALPFRYDSRTGTLQRIDTGTGGIDQPINLEVNFRLPLNRFLGYSGRIQDIINKMK
jgi:hypothetical protein